MQTSDGRAGGGWGGGGVGVGGGGWGGGGGGGGGVGGGGRWEGEGDGGGGGGGGGGEAFFPPCIVVTDTSRYRSWVESCDNMHVHDYACTDNHMHASVTCALCGRDTSQHFTHP